MQNYRIDILPPPAGTIMQEFIALLESITDEFIIGVYLTGSIPLNDFYSNKSDIDFLVICKHLPGSVIISQLDAVHKKIRIKHPTPVLSGIYLAIDSIQKWDIDHISVFFYHEGRLRKGRFDMAPVTLFELKYNSVTLLGPEPSTFVIKVREDKLNHFLYQNINSYWKKWIHNHSKIFGKGILLLLLPRLTEWAVLGVARQLCTLCTGKIVSKTESGKFCLNHLPLEHQSTIKEAIKIRRDSRSFPFLKSYNIRPSYSRMKRTIKCVNYIIAIFNDMYKERYLK